MRAIKIAAPSVGLVLIAVVLAVVLTSGGGSKKGACRSGQGACQGGASASASQAAGGAGAIGAREGATGGGAAKGTSGASAAGSAPGASKSGGSGSSTGGTRAGSPGGAGGSGQVAGASANGAAGGGAIIPTTPANTPGLVTSGGWLASGHSESGSWTVTSVLGTKMEPNVTAATITFPVPLRRPMREGHAVYVNEAEARKPGSARSAAIRAACGESGTLERPTAKPGYLCVYSAAEDLRDRTSSGAVPTHEVGGKVVPFVDAEYFAILNRNDSEGVNKTGARVAFGIPDIRTTEEEAGGAWPHMEAHGTWVVTAP
ncbi:MAG: hypothetical protein KGJ43_01580 [Acidobacteriota bacterium]|nr:hypothetical protein [Acidobacteriota bacterium]